VYLRVHAVRVAAIYQQSKSQQAATKKRAALSFHPAVRFLVYTFVRFAEGVCITRTRYNFADQQAFAAANASTLGLAPVFLLVTCAACPP